MHKNRHNHSIKHFKPKVSAQSHFELNTAHHDVVFDGAHNQPRLLQTLEHAFDHNLENSSIRLNKATHPTLGSSSFYLLSSMTLSWIYISLFHKATFSKHAGMRIVERLGIKRKTLNDYIQKVFDRGLPHIFFSGRIRAYFDHIYQKFNGNQQSNKLIMYYDNSVFIFDGNMCITSFILDGSHHNMIAKQLNKAYQNARSYRCNIEPQLLRSTINI